MEVCFTLPEKNTKENIPSFLYNEEKTEAVEVAVCMTLVMRFVRSYF